MELAEKLMELEQQLHAVDMNTFGLLPVDQQQALRKTAEEAGEIMAAANSSLAPADLQLVFATFERTALRSLPPPRNPIGDEFDPEEDEPVPTPGWPVLSPLYRMAVLAIETRPAYCRNLVNMPLLCRLLCLLDSEDPRERDAVKTLVHKIYGAFLHLRAALRNDMQAILLESIHCAAPHKLQELLEIFGSIVNGFAVPLRTEHVAVFLKKCLLPLHTVSTVQVFFPQLAYCTVQFAEKDSRLTADIVAFILRHWPKTNSLQQQLLLGEFEELLMHCPGEDFGRLRQAGFYTRLAECIASDHFQVAERALILCSNERVLEHVVADADPWDNRPVKGLLAALEQSRRKHWNKNVQAMCLAALSTLSIVDPVLYEECVKDLHIGDATEGDSDSVRPELTNPAGYPTEQRLTM